MAAAPAIGSAENAGASLELMTLISSVASDTPPLVSLARMVKEDDDGDLPDYDRLSRANVLEQVDHVRSFPFVQQRLGERTLRVHGWWFDVGSADVYAHEPDLGWVLIDEEEGARILGEPVE